MTPAQLQELLFKNIPICSKLGIEIKSVTMTDILIQVTLEPNLNHKGTAFGGSQYAIATAACYGLFLHVLQLNGEKTQDLVIAEGAMKYKKPISSDFIVASHWSLESQDLFFKTLTRKQRAKVKLEARLEFLSNLGSSYEGYFIASNKISN
ncbi:MAG: thioesterase domain-containing protein [Bdellovibrionaceae bacterium]|nr:thioesterase domain-containing protein [Pseudobdellovibrionaceae bacterium]NUM59074.1 YiiD C-terminal domain-containing protein [Pseudobdellovibrionaceae bacterium]